jgi:prevent-host-death family protein
LQQTASKCKKAGLKFSHPLDVAMLVGQIVLVKVKTAELKNNLSRYLRRVRELGETIVICDRDKPVAVLGPLPTEELDPKQKVELDEMQLRFAEAGLQLRRPTVLVTKLPKVRTIPAPDNRTDVVTVEEMRRARDW